MADKLKLTNVYGKPVNVTAAQMEKLVAKVQCLPQAFEEEGELWQNTMEGLENLLEEMGLKLDRRETPEYAEEAGVAFKTKP